MEIPLVYAVNGNGTHTVVCKCGEREAAQHCYIDDECACGLVTNVAMDNNGVFHKSCSLALPAAVA